MFSDHRTIDSSVELYLTRYSWTPAVDRDHLYRNNSYLEPSPIFQIQIDQNTHDAMENITLKATHIENRQDTAYLVPSLELES